MRRLLDAARADDALDVLAAAGAFVYFLTFFAALGAALDRLSH